MRFPLIILFQNISQFQKRTATIYRNKPGNTVLLTLPYLSGTLTHLPNGLGVHGLCRGKLPPRVCITLGWACEGILLVEVILHVHLGLYEIGEIKQRELVALVTQEASTATKMTK